MMVNGSMCFDLGHSIPMIHGKEEASSLLTMLRTNRSIAQIIVAMSGESTQMTARAQRATGDDQIHKPYVGYMVRGVGDVVHRVVILSRFSFRPFAIPHGDL